MGAPPHALYMARVEHARSRFEDCVEVDDEVGNELVEVALARARRSEHQISAVFREHRAQSFTRLTNSFDEDDVDRSDANLPKDDLS